MLQFFIIEVAMRVVETQVCRFIRQVMLEHNASLLNTSQASQPCSELSLEGTIGHVDTRTSLNKRESEFCQLNCFVVKGT